ncbi:MAG TPA: CbiX/SirB N-terminal domain-containing protein [Marinobacter sp.]|nr:CbiX/SirB N-terminal domain-containing protein [Marinobacter sp.]
MANSHRIILLAHGSSDPRWCATFEQLARPTLESVEGSVIAYMELAEPTLQSIVARDARNGIRAFTIVPLFLAAGRHLRKDVPATIKALEEELDVVIRLADPIGRNPHLGDAVREVVQEELSRAAV